jgi:hypothetical protein
MTTSSIIDTAISGLIMFIPLLAAVLAAGIWEAIDKRRQQNR